MEAVSVKSGIFSEAAADTREEIVEPPEDGVLDGSRDGHELPANSINPDGVRAQEIIESLEQEIEEELGHRRLFEGFLREYEAEGLAQR